MHTATAERRSTKKRKAMMVLAVVGVWSLLAGTAYALFLRNAAGTVQITTTSAESLPLSIYGTAPVFSQTGQTQNISFRVHPDQVGDAGSGEEYTKYRLESASVGTGPCAGYFTITGPPAGMPSGAGLEWRKGNGATGTLIVGDDSQGPWHTVTESDFNSSGEKFELTLSNSAPQSCADETVDLDVALELIP